MMFYLCITIGLLLFALSLTINFIHFKVAIKSLLVTTSFHCGGYASGLGESFLSKREFSHLGER